MRRRYGGPFGDPYGDGNAGDLGFDVTDGDLTIGLGDGLAIDTETGDLELEIAPGLDVPLDDIF